MGGTPSPASTNAIFGAWAESDPWLFFQKQFYASDPFDWDTDNDGLADGRVSFSGTWKGEDLNNNGVRDKDANDEWNETDFLANDSDVDGVFDGAEINGTYCFKVGASPCANTANPLHPWPVDPNAAGLV